MDLDTWCTYVITKLNDQSAPGPRGCRLWLGGPHNTDKYPYGSITIKFPLPDNNSKHVRVHRLALMAHNHTTNLDNALECSHLCGTPRCVNAQHLVLESKETNNERKTCHKNKKCLGTHLPECIV